MTDFLTFLNRNFGPIKPDNYIPTFGKYITGRAQKLLREQLGVHLDTQAYSDDYIEIINALARYGC